MTAARRQQLTVPFAPRQWQRAILNDSAKRIVAVVHRRAGKSTALMWKCIHKAVTTKNARVVHILPYGVMWQRTGLWDQLTEAAEAIPGAVIRRSELAIRFPNGSVFQCGGADNPDSWRGSGADLCIVDEFDDTPPSLVPLVIEPMLADRDGTLVRSGTPKGNGLLQNAYDRARITPEHSAYLLDYKSTNALSEEAIERLRAEMSGEEFAQEMECSFSSPNSGSYYGSLMDEADRDGRITSVPHDPILKVYTSWDLGIDDSTAIWFLQISRGGEWRLIDYIEDSGVGFDHYVRLLRSRPYIYASHILPHDVQARELGSGKSRLETLRGLGVSPARVVRQHAVADGVNAVRMVLPRCWFDAEKTKKGIHALRHYKRLWNESAQTWRSAPVHDHASHCFVGETNILTRHGMCRIMDLPETGEVLTPCGWSVYRSPRITRRDAPLVEVVFSGGYSVRCTPDHSFLTASGWTSASSLRTDTPILSTLTRSPSILAAVSTAFTRATIIYRAVVESCTGRRGWRPLAQSQRDVTSTIGTIIRSTTASITSNAFLLPSICLTHGGTAPRHGLTRISTSRTRPDPRPLTGIGQTRGVFGTAGWPCEQRVGSSGNALNGLASFVASQCRRLFARVTLNDFAPRLARRRPTAPETNQRCESAPLAKRRFLVWSVPAFIRNTVPSNAKPTLAEALLKHSQRFALSVRRLSWRGSTKTGTRASSVAGNAPSLRVEIVRPLESRADVWCLTVPGAECFSLSNGAVVHNCADAMRYMALGVRETEARVLDDILQKQFAPVPREYARGGDAGWMSR